MSENKLKKSKIRAELPLKWLLRFWGLAALFYWIDASRWFKSHVISHYAKLSARITAELLVLLGIDFSLQATALTVAGKTFVIAESCTGSFVFLLLSAVIITFPATLREKSWGVFLGFLTVFGLNLLRTLMIVVLVSRFAAGFWELHVIVGQALMIAGTVVFFIFWSSSLGQRKFTFSLTDKPLFKLLALYLAGFLISYLLYSLFLKSPVGSWFKEMVIRHASIVLGIVTETSYHGNVITTAKNSIKVIHSCLSSPVLVLVLAAIFTLPIPAKKRIAAYILIFFPLYYVYHLLRTVFAIWFMAGGRDSNIAYNFFGQFILIKILLIYFLYYWAFSRRKTTVGRGLAGLLLAALAALPLIWLDDFFWQSLGRPAIMSICHSDTLYNPGLIISMMPLLHTFSWFVLCLATPIWRARQRLLYGLTGWLTLSGFYAAMLALIQGLRLAPHPWAIKMFIVFLPFALYTAMFHRKKPN